MNTKKYIVIGLAVVLIVAMAALIFFSQKRTSSKSINTAEEAVSYLEQMYPEVRGYASGANELPSKSVSVEKSDNDWYVAFVQEGSGRPIIGAKCFLIRSDDTVIEREFTASIDDANTNFSAQKCSTVGDVEAPSEEPGVVGGWSSDDSGPANRPLAGGDSDEHGCKGSAGYSWCGAKNKCLRIWEEPCPSQNDSGCSIENCHGLDIQCGSNPPAACNMMYMVGDKCRTYASCGVENGTCHQIQNPKFAACKSCVDTCIGKYKDQPMEQMDCESKCE